MLNDAYPVQWAGQQAVVVLPEQIDLSNAGQIRQELLALINRGAAALILDMTATASCDQAGAEALVRAYKRGGASGTPLRLVVPAEIVRRVLSLSGLDHLVSVYPSRDAAVAAGLPVAQASAAGLSQISQDLLGVIVQNLFRAGLSLQVALDAAHEADRPPIMEALQYLDETIRGIREQVFVASRWEIPPSSERPDGAQLCRAQRSSSGPAVPGGGRYTPVRFRMVECSPAPAPGPPRP